MFKSTVLAAFILFSISSCNKLVDPGAPEASINEENVYKDDGSAIAAVTGIYASMATPAFENTVGDFTGAKSISFLCGIASDELTLYSGVSDPMFKAYYTNNLIANSTQSYGSEHWLTIYNLIFRCNAAIAGLSASGSLTPAVRQQLLGEVHFLRGFFYFYLTNMFGEVPLVTGTDPNVNRTLARSSQTTVYQLIKEDLTTAGEELSERYLNADLKSESSERIRPTKWAAAGLLSRVYLFMNDYENAEKQASLVIDNPSLYELTAADDVFLQNSMEAIWQLQPVKMGHNTEDAWNFVLPDTGPSDFSFGFGYPTYVSEELLAAFEAGDTRRKHWIDSVIVTGQTYYYPFKYKKAVYGDAVTEYLMVLRLAEIYLIRAEARAQQNNISAAQQDLDKVRTRAGLSATSASDKTSLVDAITRERQVELFTEWGHRWFDLKRLGKIDGVMNTVATAKGGSWSSFKALFPIPFVDIQRSGVIKQNTGY
ncbi:hypothetical protein BW716_06425 [[Flexibacter] sp. ATCC 35208]|nr:hypothetical protein BW716_06425 [[Flexibacter] sp. ATCC 35208]